MRFEVRVPNDDDGESLGDFECEAVPRKGDSFYIHGHPIVCRVDTDTFCGVVEDVYWETAAWGPGRRLRVGARQVNVIVWLREEAAKVTVYCTCTPEQRVAPEGADGEDGLCGNCSMTLRVRR